MADTTMTPAERRQALEAQVHDGHDWDDGDPRSWDGCGIRNAFCCRICGLVRTEYSCGQNHGDSTDYADAAGNPLTLAAAAALSCGAD